MVDCTYVDPQRPIPYVTAYPERQCFDAANWHRIVVAGAVASALVIIGTIRSAESCTRISTMARPNGHNVAGFGPLEVFLAWYISGAQVALRHRKSMRYANDEEPAALVSFLLLLRFRFAAALLPERGCSADRANARNVAASAAGAVLSCSSFAFLKLGANPALAAALAIILSAVAASATFFRYKYIAAPRCMPSGDVTAWPSLLLSSPYPRVRAIALLALTDDLGIIPSLTFSNFHPVARRIPRAESSPTIIRMLSVALFGDDEEAPQQGPPGRKSQTIESSDKHKLDNEPREFFTIRDALPDDPLDAIEMMVIILRGLRVSDSSKSEKKAEEKEASTMCVASNICRPVPLKT